MARKRMVVACLAMGVAVLMFAAGPAAGAVLLSEDFESGFTKDATIDGINGWSNANGRYFASDRTSGPVNLWLGFDLLPGSDWVGRPGPSGAPVAYSVKNFTPAAGPIVTASAAFNMQGHNGIDARCDMWLNGAGGSSTGTVRMMMLGAPNTNTYNMFTRYKNANGTEELAQAATPVTLSRELKWWEMKITYNMDTKEISWDYRGEDTEAAVFTWGPWQDVQQFTGSGPAFAPAQLEQGLLTTGGNAHRILVDNILVEDIPEPATLCLIGAGALALLRRRR